MNGEPFISVIVPVYNSADTLCDCVESVLKADFKDLELILVDDGSEDESLEIIAEYCEMDSRVRFINGEHLGPGAARNRGLDMASGLWVTFIDSDDYVEADYFSRLIEGLDMAGQEENAVENEPVMVVCGYTLDLHGGERRKARIFREDEDGDRLLTVCGMLAKCNLYPLTGPVCKLFRRESIDAGAVRFPSDMNFGEDTAFVFSYLLYCCSRMDSTDSTDSGSDGFPTVAVVSSWRYHYVKAETESLTSKASPHDWIRAYKRFYELTDGILSVKSPRSASGLKDAARSNVESHFADGILSALNLDRESRTLSRKERHECYELIYLLTSPEIFRKKMPWFFSTFGSFHIWRPYEWLHRLVYRKK